MKTLIFRLTITLTLIISFGLHADAQKRKCSVTVNLREEAGGTFREISGERFGVGQELRIEAVNRRTGQGLLFFQTPEEKSFSGIFIGKDPDGFFYRVSPGIWAVTAKSDTCTAKTEFAVPGVPMGTWGGNQVRLTVSDRWAAFTFSCAEGRIEEPIAPDVNGTVEVKGTFTQLAPFPGFPRQSVDVVYRIWTAGHVMRVAIIIPGEPEPPSSFELVYGQEPRIDFCV